MYIALTKTVNMKSNELRIGNYVNERFSNGSKRSFGVEVIKVNSILSTCLTDKVGSAYNYKYLEPIPLTEEWLLKFGFEENGEDDYILEIDEGWMYLVIESDNSFGLRSSRTGSYEDVAGGIYVEHVHQLQNLYFALTNKELTNNEQV